MRGAVSSGYGLFPICSVRAMNSYLLRGKKIYASFFPFLRGVVFSAMDASLSSASSCVSLDNVLQSGMTGVELKFCVKSGKNQTNIKPTAGNRTIDYASQIAW